MPNPMNPETTRVMINLKPGQKQKLFNLALERGFDNITQFVAAIAEGRLKYIDTELQEVLSILKQHGYTTGDPK